MALVLKTSMGATPSGVRIPHSPFLYGEWGRLYLSHYCLYIHRIKKKLLFIRQVSGVKEMAQNKQSLNLFIFKMTNIRKTNIQYQQEF